MRYLLDTDTCIHALKKRNRMVAGKIEQHAGHLGVSAISLFELRAGALGYENPESRLAIIDEFTGALQSLAFDTSCSGRAAQIAHGLRLKGQLIGAYDMLIAATALAHGLTLITGNAREFGRIAGLKLENWVA